MQELKDCRCPTCNSLLCKVNGIIEVPCYGVRKCRHEKQFITFVNGKVIKVFKPEKVASPERT